MSSRREVRGPGIAGIAVVAKPPPLRPPEHRIFELRADNARRQQYQDVLTANEVAYRRASFEVDTDRRIRERKVQARAAAIMDTQQQALDGRREKLRRLLDGEEAEYAAATAGLQETSIERMARMRHTVKSLRDSREADRLDFVTQKLDEAWRTNCDVLRTATSRQTHMFIDESRRGQVAMKEEREKQEAEVDAYYADMWLQDAAVKEAREAEEASARAAFNGQLQADQMAQMKELEDLRQQQRELKAEEQRLRLEEAALMEEERVRHLNDKKNAHARFRRTLDRDAQERAAYADTHTEAEMQADLDLLNRIEAEQKQAIADAFATKRRLARETAEYHQYLRDMEAHRKANEAIFDAACNAETIRFQRKQNAEWRAQREKRRAMMDDVIATRREQIKARQDEIKREHAEAVAEGERIKADVAAFEVEKAEATAKQAVFHDTYATELSAQIEANARRTKQERQDLVEFEASLAANARATDARVTQELSSLLEVRGMGK